jgi:hypothetical protein
MQEKGIDQFSLNHAYFCAVFGEQVTINRIEELLPWKFVAEATEDSSRVA